MPQTFAVWSSLLTAAGIILSTLLCAAMNHETVETEREVQRDNDYRAKLELCVPSQPEGSY
jgi:hypothetical protein